MPSRFNEMTFPNIGCGDAACVQILRFLRSQQCDREIKLESVCIVDGPQAQSGLKISEDIWPSLMAYRGAGNVNVWRKQTDDSPTYDIRR